MKKTILHLIFSFLAVGILFGATAFFLQKADIDKSKTVNLEPSNDYEIIDFKEPNKDIYYLSEVITDTTSHIDKDGNHHFKQSIDFNCEGMTMTVRHKKTGEEQTYNYSGYSFEIGGEKVEYDGSKSTFNIQYETQLDTIITPGTLQAQIVLITDTGDCVVRDWTFLLMCNPTSSLSSHHERNDDVHVESETTVEGLPVLPDISRAWYHANQPGVHYVSITNQEDNLFTLHIASINGDDSPIARAEVPITLENIHRDGSIVTGESDFVYTDTYGNKGQGKINVHEDAIILVIDEIYSSGKGWGISEATGVYY